MTRLRPAVLAASLAVAVGSLLAASMSPATAALNTFSYAGGAVAIPDSPGPNGTGGTPATATTTVAGTPGVIADINLRFDGSACSAMAGSTTVGLTHSWVGDLLITLTSPAGTTVTVLNRPGTTVPADLGNGGNNLCQTVFDDEAASVFPGSNAAAAPFTGSWLPVSALSAFDGQNANGTWTLTVRDFAQFDTGTIRAFSLEVDSGRRGNVVFTSSKSTAKVGGTYFPTAAGVGQNSGNPITFSVSGSPSGTCTLTYTGPKSTPTVNFVAAGTCVVTATQPGNATYGTASTTQTITMS